MNITGLGPSLVDISASLPDAVFKECSSMLEVQPGGWKSIENTDDLAMLSRLVTQSNTDVFEIFGQTHTTNLALIAGSSILGMVGAMKPEVRQTSTIATTVAVNKQGSISPISLFFTNRLRTIGIKHTTELVEGENPVGFVLSTDTNPEKILANYAGVGNDLKNYHPDKGDYVLVDAYELRSGNISKLIDELVHSQDYRICLSLGNVNILTNDLRDKIRNYIEDGKLLVLAGNSDEFVALYPELIDAENKIDFAQHKVADLVSHCLITFGEGGMVASWEGMPIQAPASPIDNHEVANTSGAGDVAMGAFVSGILLGEECAETLARASYLATQVLRVPGSMIVAQS